MKLAMIGLGKMGANMVRRLVADGHEIIAFDVDTDSTMALADELDLALMRLGTGPAVTVQDTSAGPDAQLLYNEAYRQFQQGSFEISAKWYTSGGEKPCTWIPVSFIKRSISS